MEFLTLLIAVIKDINFISTEPQKEIDLILRGKNISHYFENVYGSPETKTTFKDPK